MTLYTLTVMLGILCAVLAMTTLVAHLRYLRAFHAGVRALYLGEEFRDWIETALQVDPEIKQKVKGQRGAPYVHSREFDELGVTFKNEQISGVYFPPRQEGIPAAGVWRPMSEAPTDERECLWELESGNLFVGRRRPAEVAGEDGWELHNNGVFTATPAARWAPVYR